MNTADQYVKTIYLLQRMENDPVATDTLTGMVEVNPASANEMIGKLKSRGLAEHEKCKGVTPTNDSIVHARSALQTYCVIEHFLSNILDVEEFHAEVREPEPIIDGMITERLDTIVDHSSRCPDCFDPEAGACEYLNVCGAGPETETEVVG